MQRTQKLTKLFGQLLDVVDDEAAKNPEFAGRLEAVLAEFPSGRKKQTQAKQARPATPAPDIFDEFKRRGDEEFGFWLRSLDLGTLKTIVKQNGFDPGKNSVRWSEPDKFVALIREQTNAQLRRGSAFLPRRGDSANDQRMD